VLFVLCIVNKGSVTGRDENYGENPANEQRFLSAHPMIALPWVASLESVTGG
jgi:hypothetical protein